MFCGSCGAEIAKDNRFCSVCGQAVSDVSNTEPKEVVAEAEEVKESFSVSNIPAWLLAVLAPVVMTIPAFISHQISDGIFQPWYANSSKYLPFVVIAYLILLIIDLIQIRHMFTSKAKFIALAVTALLCYPLYLILRATIVSGFSLKRFIPAVVCIIMVISSSILIPFLNKPTIKDDMWEIESSISRKFSESWEKDFRIVVPLRLIKISDNTYEGSITLRSDDGQELDLTVEVLYEDGYWQWETS
jgi:hypothetical protein